MILFADCSKKGFPREETVNLFKKNKRSKDSFSSSARVALARYYDDLTSFHPQCKNWYRVYGEMARVTYVAVVLFWWVRGGVGGGYCVLQSLLE